MRPLVLTRRGILGTLAVLVVAGVCARLGVWQLDRGAEREARNAVIVARMEAEPVRLDSPPADTGLAYRRATVVGEVDDSRAIVLAGRSLNGAPGVHLLSPVRFGGGAVLVNRGWLPARDGATVDLDAFRLRGGLRVEGVLLPFPDVDVETQPGGFQDRWFRFDGDAIRAQYPYPVSPLYLSATSAPEPTPAQSPGSVSATPVPAADSVSAGPIPAADSVSASPIPVGGPAVDPGPHLSYAIQWFSFAAIALLGWAVLFLQRARPADGLAGKKEG